MHIYTQFCYENSYTAFKMVGIKTDTHN